MAPTGIQKAAALLKALDPDTAGQLLQAAPSRSVPEIAAEILCLGGPGQPGGHPTDGPATEFLGLLHGKQTDGRLETFVQQVIHSAVGKDRTEQILDEARRIVDSRDPFLSIRSADIESLSKALRGEHPQAAAVVLGELPPERSGALVPLLDESVRGEAVRRMLSDQATPNEARARIAATVRKRLDAMHRAPARPGGAPAEPQDRLRQVALLLRGLRQEMRDGLLQTIADRDADTRTDVQNMMVIWEDLPVINDRNLQEVLREMDARDLALALCNAEETIETKIRGNVSERAGAMLDEEASLMRDPQEEDIEAAREKLLGHLRNLNAEGHLRFMETKADDTAAAG